MGAEMRFFWFLAILFSGQELRPVEAFKQELWLLFDNNGNITQGNHLYFDTNQPNFTAYGALLPSVKMYCTVGVWETFKNVNYSARYEELGSESSADVVCKPLNAQPVLSLRYFVAPDTSTDAISLFPEKEYGGAEMVVTEKALVGITIPILSIGATGSSDWMLYEGQRLNGKSVCYEVPWKKNSKPAEKYYFNWTANLTSLNLKEIRSVYKGCSEKEIREFKFENYFM